MSPRNRAALWAAFSATLVAAAVGGLASEPVRLRQSPPLGRKIAALPRVVAKPGDEAATQINRALAQDDADAKSAAADCRKIGKKNSDFSRSVTVTMRGPTYLAVVATRSWFCAGAYPDWGSTPFVFDLATGAPVDWKQVLPAALIDKTVDYNASGEGLIVSSELAGRYVAAQTDGECRDALADWDGGLGFILWPDAAGDGIAIEANNLPHAAKACALNLTIATSDLRKLGVAAALLDAIDGAHRHGWYDKPATGKR